MPPIQAALPEPVRKVTPFRRNPGVKYRDEEQEQQEIRDRVLEVLHKECAARDSGESDQSDDLRVRRKWQADRQSCDARGPEDLAKRKVGQQDDDPHEEHSRYGDSVER